MPDSYQDDDPRAERIAERAADRAIERTFRMFGIDLDDAEAVNAWRDDWQWVRRRRAAAEARAEIWSKGAITALFGALVTALSIIGTWCVSHWGRPQ